jgi:hypothetical protein
MKTKFNIQGFQVTYWSCYHVDDIDECTPDIPSFNQLKNKSISQILQDSLSVEEGEGDRISKSLVDLNLLLNKCAYMACSMITDTNLMRTIDRIQIYLNLVNGCVPFRNILIKYLIGLQTQKEALYSATTSSWFVKDVANSSNVKKYLTLRNACKNYIESKLSPLIGAILAQIDNYFNLDILHDQVLHCTDLANSWTFNLWLNVLNNQAIIKVNYDSLLNKGSLI